MTAFAELGLVRESRIEDSTTWEPFHDDSVIHLRCAGCGTVSHHHTELVRELRRALEADGSFAPDEVDVRVEGRCPDCAASGSDAG